MRSKMLSAAGALGLLAAPLHAGGFDSVTARDLLTASTRGGELRAYIVGLIDGQSIALAITENALGHPVADIICPRKTVTIGEIENTLLLYLRKWPKDRLDQPAGNVATAILEAAYPCK